MGPQIASGVTTTVTGSDAARSYMQITIDPAMKVNEAIKLKARYRLSQYGDPSGSSHYYTQDSPGTDNAFSEGKWTMFWATAVTPWGSLGIGKRPWKFGTGLQYGGSDGLTTESMVLSAPFGPFDIGVAFYPHRATGQPASISNSGDPFDLVIPQYFNHADKSGSLLNDLLAFVVYNEGPVQAGILAAGGGYHVGPEAGLVNPTGAGALPNPHVAQDSAFFHGAAFVKYFSGRFFFNGEAAWLYWTDKLSGPGILSPAVSLAPILAPTPRYVEQWRYLVEAGTLAGPSKIGLLFAWMPGPDRRNSLLIGKQSAAFVWHPTFDRHLGNYDLLRPYAYLLPYNYGAGLNAYNLTGNGYVRDAWILAGRFDYAVASNLNLFASFLWAERTSCGYGWGCIAPNDPGDPLLTTPPAPPALLPPTGVNDGSIRFSINGAPGSPNIPDRALGWEITTGFDWKVLEGLTASALFAYWRPGKWFAYACIDRSVVNWNIPSASNFWGARPGRSIDPVIGGFFSLCYSF
jgi:hypothetical protein